MATIGISHLRPAYDLLSDSESFMSNLSEEEVSIQGGLVLVWGLVLFVTLLLSMNA